MCHADAVNRYLLQSFSYPTSALYTEDPVILQILEDVPDKTQKLFEARLRDVIAAGQLVDPDEVLGIEVTVEIKVIDKVIL